MIEAEVHQRLRAFLRQQREPYWPHHLTMARLVARALRLGRSALIQTGSMSAYHGHHRLSYLMAALLWPGAVVLVATEGVQQRLLQVDIPRLRQWMPILKPIQQGERWPGADYQGLLLTTPAAWLGDRLGDQTQFPVGLPTLIDGAEDLENWVQQQLTLTLTAADWEQLMLTFPSAQEVIRDSRVQITHALFQRPANPYGCHSLEPSEQQYLQQIHDQVRGVQAAGLFGQSGPAPQVWQRFWQMMTDPDALLWADVDRDLGQLTLHCGRAALAPTLGPLWQQQPLVLMGAAMDLDTQALTYRQRLGLGNLTCLKFCPDRQQPGIPLYLPDRLPLPNTPGFQGALLQALRALLTHQTAQPGLTVVLVGDEPLKLQTGTQLAAEFGSRVQVEATCLDDNGVLVTGWDFWQQHQPVLPSPQLLVVATLPIPSLEHPVVAGRVAHYKHQRQDWFRLYLLPTALVALQRAIAPLRDSHGVLALLDNRVNCRTYGAQVLEALSPVNRSNYIDPNWFEQPGATLESE